LKKYVLPRGINIIILCIDNMPIMLQSLKENAAKAFPYVDIQTFLVEEASWNYAEKCPHTGDICVNAPKS
jgi:hypothetical protein